MNESDYGMKDQGRRIAFNVDHSTQQAGIFVFTLPEHYKMFSPAVRTIFFIFDVSKEVPISRTLSLRIHLSGNILIKRAVSHGTTTR